MICEARVVSLTPMHQSIEFEYDIVEKLRRKIVVSLPKCIPSAPLKEHNTRRTGLSQHKKELLNSQKKTRMLTGNMTDDPLFQMTSFGNYFSSHRI